LWVALFWVEAFVWEQEVAIQWIKERWPMVTGTMIASRLRSEYALLVGSSIDRYHGLYLVVMLYAKI
jgi:hypothetical protein